MQERLKQAATIDEAAYLEARKQLDRLRQIIDEIFTEVDFIVTPTSPVPPITIEEALNMAPPPAGELWLRNTRPFNAYGTPTISIPCGFTRAGLPIGLQIAGPSFGESNLLSFARAYEQATSWHKRTPALIQ
jgi:aspartyl-tRNA(Asn)/glutamyl-tRNA(Gln) amidotransferase subunit A